MNVERALDDVAGGLARIQGRRVVSPYAKNGFPKYVWAVDQDNEVYEAKLGGDDRRSYHGYALNAGRERDLCRWVIREWNARAGTS